MNIAYSKSEQRFEQKLTAKDIKQLKLHSCRTSIEELINHIQSAKPFTCQTYVSNVRRESEFISQQAFAFDFDETLTVAEIDAICKDYGLEYNFGYYTYRHRDSAPRFRIIFVCDGEVRDGELAKHIIESFQIIFQGNADKQALDLARLWAGTTKATFIGKLDSTFQPDKILIIANEKKYAKAGNRKRKYFPYESIITEKKGNNTSAIIYRYNDLGIPYNSVGSVERLPLITNWNIEDLLRCKLFARFYEGKGTPCFDNKKLYDKELTCIASNLMEFEGGEKLYKACLDKNQHYSKEKYSKVSWFRHQDKYKPYLIGLHSPYEEDQNSPYQTLAEYLQNKKGHVGIDEATLPKIYSLHDAEKRLHEAFKRIIEDIESKVYLIRAAPGSGKSKFWINQAGGVAIGFPNNRLKQEQFHKSELPLTLKYMTPDALESFSDPVKAYLTALYNRGAGEKANQTIKRIAVGESIGSSVQILPSDVDYAADYIRAQQAIKNLPEEVTVFTTHFRLLHQNFKQPIYVFDENPFDSLMKINKGSFSDLKSVLAILITRGRDTAQLHDIIKAKPNQVYSTPQLIHLHEEVKAIIEDQKLKTNVLDFFLSSRFIIDGEHIHYQSSQIAKLPDDKKIVFLDATGSETLYRMAFGDRLEVIDLSNVEFEGKLIQHTLKSFSKSGMAKDCKTIANVVGDMQVITHKSYKHYFTNYVEHLHFGNVVGSNDLTGKDLCVVGTFTYPPKYYQFLAHSLDVDCDDFKMKNLKVTYNGRIFVYHTYRHPLLQKLHLEQVEGELIQAVHRARLIRHNATVTLYSNFPLLQATYNQTNSTNEELNI